MRTLCQSQLYPQSGNKNLAFGTGTFASFDTFVTLLFTPLQIGFAASVKVSLVARNIPSWIYHIFVNFSTKEML
jgi:hypothetical protein